ncbi:MAG: RES domain-containing protein [Bacteroidota bacterium]
MVVYRIAKATYCEDISGTGAKIYGGKWTPKGMTALYTSETRSLSTLELLVHTDYDLTPPKFKLLSIELPLNTEDIKVIALEDLPKNWKNAPPPVELKNLGKQYLIEENNLAIKVPSVIIPEEYNVVINPMHQSFKDVQIKRMTNYEIDIRLIN